MVDLRFRKFHVTAVFRVPLPFAYDWCTDYSPDDAKIAGEDKLFNLQRRFVLRSPRQVIFENVYDEQGGWGWERHTVTLLPPTRWHSDGFGNYGESHLDYRLSELPGGRTLFDMNWVSRPNALDSGPRPTKEVVERFVRLLWRRRARVLERDYRTSLKNGANA